MVLFHPISKFGGSGFTSPVLDFRSRMISDLLRFSMEIVSGFVVVCEDGIGFWKSMGSGDEFEVHLMVKWVFGHGWLWIVCSGDGFAEVWLG